MGWRAVRTVWFKELVDSVRDRRTLVMMILLPLILMPLITLAGPLLLQRQMEATEQSLPPVMLVGGTRAAELADRFAAAGVVDVIYRTELEREEAEQLVRDGAFEVVVFASQPMSRPTPPWNSRSSSRRSAGLPWTRCAGFSCRWRPRRPVS